MVHQRHKAAQTAVNASNISYHEIATPFPPQQMMRLGVEGFAVGCGRKPACLSIPMQLGMVVYEEAAIRHYHATCLFELSPNMAPKTTFPAFQKGGLSWDFFLPLWPI